MKLRGSWRTTGGGIGAIILGLGMIISGFAGGDMGQVAAGAGSIVSGIGLMAARDDKVSSEEAGAK